MKYDSKNKYPIKDKIFVIFAVRRCYIDTQTDKWLSLKDFENIKNHSIGIYNINDFEKLELELIDINNEKDSKIINLENLEKINIIGKVEYIIEKKEIK